MSGKPLQLCKLKRGKALAAFPTFVDTFNWIVDFCNNLKGDAEIDSSKSCRVDRSIEDSPVIKVEGAGSSITADGSFSVITDLRLDQDSGEVQVKNRLFTVKDGYVTSVGPELDWVNKISTVAHSSLLS